MLSVHSLQSASPMRQVSHAFETPLDQRTLRRPTMQLWPAAVWYFMKVSSRHSSNHVVHNANVGLAKWTACSSFSLLLLFRFSSPYLIFCALISVLNQQLLLLILLKLYFFCNCYLECNFYYSGWMETVVRQEGTPSQAQLTDAIDVWDYLESHIVNLVARNFHRL